MAAEPWVVVLSWTDSGGGNEVLALTRSRSKLLERLPIQPTDLPGQLKIIEGDPTIPGAWQSSVNGCDAVVHLAGAGLMDHRWSQAYRATLRESRIDSTYQIVRAIKQAAIDPGPCSMLQPSVSMAIETIVC